MSFQEKNIIVTLVNFCLILGYYSISLFQMVQNGSFSSTNVFRLWGVIFVLAVVVTILATMLTHVVSAIIQTIKTKEKHNIEDIQDERDQLIDLKGTKITYLVYSIGACISMLTFVFSQPPLVMFTLLIFFGVVAQIVGDTYRLYLYRKGF
jgi:hypothetical protein